MAFYRSHVLVCVDPECLAKGAYEVVDALQDELVAQGLIDEIQVLETSRIGKCSEGPEMMVYPDGVHYRGMSVDDIPYLVEEHFLKGRVVERFREEIKPIVDEELGPLRPRLALEGDLLPLDQVLNLRRAQVQVTRDFLQAKRLIGHTLSPPIDTLPRIRDTGILAHAQRACRGTPSDQ